MSQTPIDTADGSPRGAKRRLESRKRLLASARKLFIARGYHATRPQDISKGAGLGHGTFYLHFKDKRECFLAFVDEARAELDAAVIARASSTRTLAQMVEAALTAIYDYAEQNPGVLPTAMTDEAVIASGGDGAEGTLIQRWGEEWGELLRTQAKDGVVAKDFDFAIVGQAIVGAIHQASSYSFRRGRSRSSVVKALSQFIVRALSPKA
ncbi:MAG: TetR/AcrR family transcriptional regulator [Alphaproteobacteria bacterium]|nr:TetR/AcrR family transcriptional regulator [Alphaproteobacteria bacterium]